MEIATGFRLERTVPRGRSAIGLSADLLPRLVLSMRIMHVWPRLYPFDIRVAKISRTLAAAGHEVHIVAANSGQQLTMERQDGVIVHRLPCLPGLPGYISSLTCYPAAWNPRWMIALNQVCARVRPDVILARDIQLALLCLAIARRFRLPALLDLPEHWPATLAAWRATEPLGLRNLLTRSITVCKTMERLTVPRFDHVFVCVEEMVDRLSRMGVSPGRLSLVRNTPDLELYPRLDDAQRQRAAGIRGRLCSEFVVVYEGEINVFRGLDVLVRAMALLRRDVPSARLICIGKGKPANERVIRRVIDQLGMTDAVLFTGWLEQSEMLDYVAAADVGAAPFYLSECIEYTLGNKVFDYMSLGKPAVATDARPIRRLLEGCQCGVVVPSRDERAMASAFRSLLDAEYRRKLGENGMKAVREKYNWSVTDGQVIGVVFNRLANAARGGRALTAFCPDGEGGRDGENARAALPKP